MALSDLWLTARDQLSDKLVKQIISFAGSGQLRDGNDASSDFRDYLSRVPSTFLARYANECLRESFEGSGFALQDIINQIGKRLGFSVTYGRYRGVQSQIGFDGLWRFPNGHSVIIEVKTTDTYRIDLNAVVNYRRGLINQGDCSEDQSSILYIVGREDTGGLEAQIRGSRYAWDIRLISIDALLRLLALKEEVEDPRIIEKICAVLIPREYTRVDSIIDIVFSTAEDVRQEEEVVEPEEHPRDEKHDVEGPQRLAPVDFHEACIRRIEKHLGQSLVKHSRTSYSSPDGTVALTCAVSKEYERHGQQSYWFAFHPHQKEHLESTQQASVSFGCGSDQTVVLIPYSDFSSWLDGMNITSGEDRFYWHVRMSRDGEQLFLHMRGGAEQINLTRYLLRTI